MADELQRDLRARSLITDLMNSPAFSLQRDSTNQAVNWDAVDDELDKIPSELKDPRFDSLRHVLNILSAVDAEAALEEVHLCWRVCHYVLTGPSIPGMIVRVSCSFEGNETQ